MKVRMRVCGVPGTLRIKTTKALEDTRKLLSNKVRFWELCWICDCGTTAWCTAWTREDQLKGALFEIIDIEEELNMDCHCQERIKIERIFLEACR